MTSHAVIREDLACAEQALQYETLFTIGNGYVGVRGLLEEQETHPGFDSTRVHGLFNAIEGDLSPDLVPAPHWLGLTLDFDGHPFSLDTGRVLGYERALDVSRATLSRRVLWQSPQGDVVRLEF